MQETKKLYLKKIEIKNKLKKFFRHNSVFCSEF